MKHPRFVLFCVLFVALILVDQWSKYWIRINLVESASFGGKPWPGVFEITHTTNRGIAFGLFQGLGVWLAPVAFAIAAGAAYYSYRHPKEHWLTHGAMGLLASGAIGNVYDRIRYGKVTDMFHLRIIDFPVFNVADSCITIATLILILTWMREPKHSAKVPATETPDPEPEYPAERA